MNQVAAVGGVGVRFICWAALRQCDVGRSQLSTGTVSAADVDKWPGHGTPEPLIIESFCKGIRLTMPTPHTNDNGLEAVLGPPATCSFSPISYRTKGALILSSLLEDLAFLCHIPTRDLLWDKELHSRESCIASSRTHRGEKRLRRLGSKFWPSWTLT